MTIVYGGCIEPGGMKLDNYVNEVDCPECGKQARSRAWEDCEGGSINSYFNVSCDHCGYFEGDHPYEPDEWDY